MNKCLRQNWKIFNKVKFSPIELDEPDGLKNINEWAEKTWNHLVDDELKRHAIYVTKGKQGHVITVWTDEELIYLVQVVRTEYNTDETLIYAIKYTDANLSDFKTIAKFIHKNIKSIIGHSIKGVHALNKLKEAQQIQEDISSGRA